MMFDIPNLIRGLGGVEKTKEAIEYFRQKTVEAGFPGLELQICLKGKRKLDKVIEGDMTQREVINSLGFDSGVFYQYFDLTPMNRAYPEVLEDALREFDDIVKTLNFKVYPHVSVGWDSNPRYNIFHDDVCFDNTPENVQKAFERAKEYIDTHPELDAPLITVNSWNEWTETSYLHPDDLYGYGYLEAIKNVFVEK